VKDKEREAELKKLRIISAEAKEQVQSLKEENTRKAQLLAKMKETKLSDNEIIDRSTKEAADNDATAKRSASAVYWRTAVLYSMMLIRVEQRPSRLYILLYYILLVCLFSYHGP
jgi:hypothetical protein